MKNISDNILRSQVNVRNSVIEQIEKLETSKGGRPTVDEDGSTTVEYAIGAVATAAFAGLLLAVLSSGGVQSMLTNIINSALSF